MRRKSDVCVFIKPFSAVIRLVISFSSFRDSLISKIGRENVFILNYKFRLLAYFQSMCKNVGFGSN